MTVYVFAVIVGLCLGLLGAGGSILIVPVLVYILKIEPKVSIALSLAIVGATSLIGAFSHYQKDNISFRTIAFFAPFTMLGAYLGSYLAGFVSGQTQLILFAFIMLSASILMIKNTQKSEKLNSEQKLVFIITGFTVGVISGLLGVGGGFLIVPALVLLADLPMRQAVGTSLAVISLSALTGFSAYAGSLEIPWALLFQFVFFSGIGIVIGSRLVQYVSQKKLRKAFAYFLVFMGLFMLVQNIFI